MSRLHRFGTRQHFHNSSDCGCNPANTCNLMQEDQPDHTSLQIRHTFIQDKHTNIDAVGKLLFPFSPLLRQEQAHFILRSSLDFFCQTGKGPRPMHSGPQSKSHICVQRAIRTSHCHCHCELRSSATNVDEGVKGRGLLTLRTSGRGSRKSCLDRCNLPLARRKRCEIQRLGSVPPCFGLALVPPPGSANHQSSMWHSC